MSRRWYHWFGECGQSVELKRHLQQSMSDERRWFAEWKALLSELITLRMQNGKLSRIIYRQREAIRKLKPNKRTPTYSTTDEPTTETEKEK